MNKNTELLSTDSSWALWNGHNPAIQQGPAVVGSLYDGPAPTLLDGTDISNPASYSSSVIGLNATMTEEPVNSNRHNALLLSLG